MDLSSLDAHVRLIGVLSFTFIAYAAWLGAPTADGLPDGYKNPVLALELVKNEEDIIRIRDARGARVAITNQLRKDPGFIALYVAQFSAVGLLLLRTVSTPLKWVAGLGVICVVVAGVFDLIENRGMRQALEPTSPRTGLANSIRYPALIKWALIYVFAILTGSQFVGRHELGTISLLSFGWVLLLGGIIGLAGTILNALRPRFYITFLISLALLSLAGIYIAIIFTFLTSKVVATLG